MSSVGVIIRTKNRPFLLGRALRSVLTQEAPPAEIVLVNDGGETLATSEIWTTVSKAKGAHTRLRLLELPASKGVGAAANVGLAVLQTDFIALHDDDDSWSSAYLRDTLAAFEAQRTAGSFPVMVGAPVVQIQESLGQERGKSLEHSRQPWSPGLPVGPISLSRILLHNVLPPIGLVYHRDSVVAVGGWREDIPVLEDWALNRALLLRGNGYCRDGAPAFYHVRAEASDDYANTIVARRRQHLETRERLLNEWLREDLLRGSFGPGLFAHWQLQAKEQIELESAILRELRQGAWLRDGKALFRQLRRLWSK